jgi:predicted amidohydrolase YtcJ
MYSINGAYGLGREDQFGVIAEGKDADLVVLSDQLSNLAAENWGQNIEVEMTIANGKVIYNQNE